MLDLEHGRGVVHGAVAVVVVADGAVEQVIAEDAIEGLALGGVGALRFGEDSHAFGGGGSAGANQLAVGLDHAGIAGLDRAELMVVTDLGKGSTRPGERSIDGVDQDFAGLYRV